MGLPAVFIHGFGERMSSSATVCRRSSMTILVENVDAE
jgi:hypothetical protein